MEKKLLLGEVTLEQLLDRLAFSDEETQRAALEQPKLFMAAASYRVSRMKDRQEAEAKLDDLRINRSIQLRVKYAGGAKKGMTEKYLNDLIDRNQEVRQARDEALKARRREEWAKLLLEAYDHRRSSIKVMAQFAWMEDSFQAEREVEGMKKKRERLKAKLPERELEDL